jgi:type IV pilus assembly protein PilC
MIRSAEVTGRMDEVMVFLADYLEKEFGLATRVRNALIYPIVVIVLFIAVAMLMVTVVLPSIAPIFAESKVPLPVFTRALLGISQFVLSWWWALGFFVLVFVVFFLDYMRTPEGKAVVDEAKTRLPIIGNLLIKLYVARLSEAIGVLLQGGIPVTQAVEIASHTVGNAIYRDLLHEVGERINAGELLSQALSRNPVYFPPILTQMTAVGESTGSLVEVLKKISKFYTQEVDSIVANLVELIQPALMVSVGVMVGLLFAAILLPLYDLAKAF